MDGCLQSGTRRSSAQATAPHAWAFRLCRLPSHTRSSVFPHTLGLPCLSPLTPGVGEGVNAVPTTTNYGSVSHVWGTRRVGTPGVQWASLAPGGPPP